MATILLRRRKLGRTSARAISELSREGIRVVRNDKPMPDNVTQVIRWGCTADVPTRNVINRADAIHLVNNKLEFRRILDDEELCPSTWFNERDIPRNMFPVVIRPARHAQGRQLWVAENQQEVVAIVNAHQLQQTGFYVSQLINKVAEYRVFVAQGRVICVAQKTPANPDEVAWNVARGGRFDNVRWDNWPLKACRIAVEAFSLSGLDFGGVDVMVDAEGQVFVLEINSAPSLTSPYRQQCMARALDWMIQNGKDTIPLINRRGGYRKFIHPAVCEAAMLAA